VDAEISNKNSERLKKEGEEVQPPLGEAQVDHLALDHVVEVRGAGLDGAACRRLGRERLDDFLRVALIV
jgi:hypothetical protein